MRATAAILEQKRQISSPASWPLSETVHQEARLLWRSWATRLGLVFTLLVILSQHPALDGSILEYSAEQLAGTWADRAGLMSCILTLFIAPFVLDRLRRASTADLELSRPFPDHSYLLGKWLAVLLTLLLLPLMSGLLHLIVSWETSPGASLLQLSWLYLRYACLVILAPLFFSCAAVFFFSLFLRPLLIIPIYLVYFITTTLTSAAAQMGFSWWSPLVRPEYFHSLIPSSIVPMVWHHQALYLSLAGGLLLISPLLFRRSSFLDGTQTKQKPIHTPLTLQFPRLPAAFRRVWIVPVVAATLWTVVSPLSALDPNPRYDFIAVDSAFLALEFYLSLSGLLLIAGGLGLDARWKAADLLLTRPVRRWRLLAERILPGLLLFGLLATGLIAFIHLTYIPLPLGKALFVTLTTGIYLGMVGLTISNLTHSVLAGFGGGFLFWLLEAGFQGKLTAPFFLLICSHQPAVDALGGFWRSADLWLPAKIGILLLSAILFLANGWLMDRGKTRRVALISLLILLPLIYAAGWLLIPLHHSA